MQVKLLFMAVGESPLIRRGESAYGPDGSPDSPGRVWKRDMANMRSVYQKPIRKLGFDGRNGRQKDEARIHRRVTFCPLGRQRRLKASKGDPRATKSRRRSTERRLKVDQSQPKVTKSQPKSPKGHQKSTQVDTKAPPRRIYKGGIPMQDLQEGGKQ